MGDKIGDTGGNAQNPPPTSARRATGADVARATGLSRATVSYVLNNTPHQMIPASTRQRVLAAAANLGYTQSAAARTLRRGRSDVVLGLLPDWPLGPILGGALEHLSGQLARRGLTFLVSPYARHDRPLAEVWKALTPAAVVAFQHPAEEEVATLRAAGIVLVVSPVEIRLREGAGAEDLDRRLGRLQAEHLAAGGHRRLAYAYPDDPRVAAFADLRLSGLVQACAELGLAEPLVATVPLTPAGGREAVTGWRRTDPTVTAVCAYNDDVALAVLAGLYDEGLTAPGDLAVMGVDDIPAAATSRPPLTTVSLDVDTFALEIARTVTAALSGASADVRLGSDVAQVVVRGSA